MKLVLDDENRHINLTYFFCKIPFCDIKKNVFYSKDQHMRITETLVQICKNTQPSSCQQQHNWQRCLAMKYSPTHIRLHLERPSVRTKDKILQL